MKRGGGLAWNTAGKGKHDGRKELVSTGMTQRAMWDGRREVTQNIVRQPVISKG